jgi:hypothetical protein
MEINRMLAVADTTRCKCICMKHHLLVFFLFVGSFCGAQNLVPNSSFEEYDVCPNTISQISRAKGWNAARPTPDYFNSCAPYYPHPISCVAVPLNSFGYRTPASGNAYIGIISKSINNEDREIIGAELVSPLQTGVKYYVSFKVSFIGQMYQPNRCSINKLGVLFSTSLYDSLSFAPICNCAQVYSDSIISDTLNWTRITGAFVADSNYSFINIGRFFDDTNTDSIQISGTLGLAYYFIDDVCVSTDSVFTYSYTYTDITESNILSSIIIYPNPTTDFVNIDFGHLNEPLDIAIYDELGSVIFFKDGIISPVEHIPITDVISDFLFVKITYKSGSITRKIVKISD